MNLTKRNLTTMSSPWANQHADVLNRAQLEPIDPSIVYTDGNEVVQSCGECTCCQSECFFTACYYW